MIARVWKGAVRRDDADAYAEYMQDSGVAGYARVPGNRGVWMLRRDLGETAEFMMFTLWESLDAVEGFAGEDFETAVFYPEDDRFLVQRDETSTHYDVDTHLDGPSDDCTRSAISSGSKAPPGSTGPQTVTVATRTSWRSGGRPTGRCRVRPGRSTAPGNYRVFEVL